MLIPVMLLLVATLIKITQGYSLKQHSLSSSWRMRLLHKKLCLNSMASLHCNYSSAGDLFLSTSVLLWRYPGQTESVLGLCFLGTRWACGPSLTAPWGKGFTDSPMPCNCFFWSQTSIKEWLMSDFPSHCAEKQHFSQAPRPGKRKHGEGESVKR